MQQFLKKLTFHYEEIILSLSFLAFHFLTFAQEQTIDEKIEAGFKPFADAVSFIVFYPISIVGIEVPIVIIVLLLGALFLHCILNLQI